MQREPRVDHANLGVAVKDGVVTLSGNVSSYASKLAAEKAARRVEGVRGLAEETEVRFSSDAKTLDAIIAKRIVDMLDWCEGRAWMGHVDRCSRVSLQP